MSLSVVYRVLKEKNVTQQNTNVSCTWNCIRGFFCNQVEVSFAVDPYYKMDQSKGSSRLTTFLNQYEPLSVLNNRQKRVISSFCPHVSWLVLRKQKTWRQRKQFLFSWRHDKNTESMHFITTTAFFVNYRTDCFAFT